MKTTLTKCFEGGLFAGLARVNRAKDKKQMLQEIAAEACVGIDMAKGLQGRGDWIGSVTKLYAASDAIIQAIDLAETFAGVRMDKTRAVVNDASEYLKDADSKVDLDPISVRTEVKKCEAALECAAKIIETFAAGLNDTVMAKSAMEFSEQALLDSVSKYMGGRPTQSQSARAEAARNISDRMRSLGLMSTPSAVWEAEPGNPARQRRKKADGGYEYRDVPGMPATAEKVLDENGAKIEKPEEEIVETEEKPEVEEAEKNLHKSLNFGRFFKA